MTVQEELEAIDVALDELRISRSKGHFNTIRQVGVRLKEFLFRRGITLQVMIEGNLGELEIVGGVTGQGKKRKESCIEQNSVALRTIMDKLCERGVMTLDYGRCVISAVGMNPHRDPRGLEGFPEAILGIYPGWLVPERFRRGIEHNAAVPERIKAEFQEVIALIQDETKGEGGINEQTIKEYWEKTRKLVLSLGNKSLHDLEGQPGADRLQQLFKTSGFNKATSTVRHLSRVLNAALGTKSPFRLKNAEGEFLLRLSKPPKVTTIAEGKKFRKSGKLHTVVGGIIRGCSLRFSELRRLVHFKNLRTILWRSAAAEKLEELFREAQEDILVKVCCIVKDRPAERKAHNWGDWKLIRAEPFDSESRLYNGDGVIFNNFRESSRKTRPDKPFPKWLADLLDHFLWPLRRAVFNRKGNCDLTPSQETGLLRQGIPMFVDPRTGRRATENQLDEWTQRGLIRAGMDPKLAEVVTGYWFRRGVSTAEKANADLDEIIATTGGQSVEVFNSRYNFIHEEMALLVAHERRNFWIPLGIGAAVPSNPAGPVTLSPEGTKELAKQIAQKIVSRHQAVSPMCDGEIDDIVEQVVFQEQVRLGEREAANLAEVSASTLKRWAQLGFFGRHQDGRHGFYLKLEIEEFKRTYATTLEAAKALGCSDSYIRRRCRRDEIPGIRRVGKKSYLVPWAWVNEGLKKKVQMSRDKKGKRTVQTRNLNMLGIGTSPTQNAFLA